MAIAKLASLSLDQLVWAMIAKLNRIQDLGGVSVGRSIRSAYLQIPLGYEHHYQILREVDVDSMCSENVSIIAEEARNRTFVVEQPVLFRELTLGQMTNRQLVETAMSEMGKWYEKDRKRPDCSTNFEYILAKEITRLLAPRVSAVYQFPDRKIQELHAVWFDREFEWLEAREWSLYQQALCRT